MKVELNDETVKAFATVKEDLPHQVLKLLYSMESTPAVHNAIDDLQAIEHALPVLRQACRDIL